MSDVEDAGGAGVVTPSIRFREIGATSVACPMLTPTNYTVWSLAMGLLYQAIPEALIMQIGDVADSKTLWESIKARYIGADRVKEARLQTLNTDFDRLRMNETESIDSFAGKLSGLASKSASLGETIDESKLVKKLLKVVPKRFIHLVASLEQVLDLKSVGFEDVVGRLKAFEERIREDDDGDGQPKVMLSRSCDGDGYGGGYGGGGDFPGSIESSGGAGKDKWGRKKTGEGFNHRFGSKQAQSGSKQAQSDQSWPNPNQNRPNSRSDPNRNPKKDLSKIKCYRCEKLGHYASKCPEKIQKFQECNFNEEDDPDEAVFLHETI